MVKVAVVGSLNMDLVIRTPRLPVPGETIIGRDFATVPGGKGANQAIAAARLDAQVAMIGRVGADDFGKTLRENLVASGVNTGNVTIDNDTTTGVAVIQVDDSGQNTIVVTPGANAHLTRADIESARTTISSADVLVAQLEIPLDTVKAALRMAHEANILTILNPAPAQSLASDVLTLADVIIPNETEAMLLTGIRVHDWSSAEAAACALHQSGSRIVIITLGALGAFALQDNQAHPVPPFPVNTIDATAAGDAFVAAFAVGYASGKDFTTALQEASAAGTLATTKFGAQPSLPTRAELLKFMNQRNFTPLPASGVV